MSFYVKVAAAAVTFSATLATTYIALSDRPKKFTAADWSKQANAVCQQDFGTLGPAGSDALVAMAQILPQIASAQGLDAIPVESRKAVTSGMSAVVGGLSKMLGDMRAIRSPVNHRLEIEGVLSAGDSLLASFGHMSAALQTIFFNVPDEQGRTDLTAIVADTAATVSTVIQTKLPNWGRATAAMGLSECGASVVPPAARSVPTTAAPAQSSLTSAEVRLVGMLNSNIFDRCLPAQNAEGHGVVAAVNCKSVPQGPSKSPLVVQFDNATDAQTWFSSLTKGVVDENDCAGGHRLGSWTHDTVESGALGCFATSDGFRVVWTFSNQLVGIIADGPNGVTMSQWFQSWGYALRTG